MTAGLIVSSLILHFALQKFIDLHYPPLHSRKKRYHKRVKNAAKPQPIRLRLPQIRLYIPVLRENIR